MAQFMGDDRPQQSRHTCLMLIVGQVWDVCRRFF